MSRPSHSFYEISDFVQRWKLSFILPNLWKLLCICGQEMRFVKTQLNGTKCHKRRWNGGMPFRANGKRCAKSSHVCTMMFWTDYGAPSLLAQKLQSHRNE